jgi:hypothetical protein
MQNQKPNTANDTKNSTEKKSGSAENPAAQATTSSPPAHQPKAATLQTKTDGEGKHWLDYAVGVFAFIAAIGGVGAAIFTGVQVWIASDNEVRQLRAYVHITPGIMSGTGAAEGPLTVTLRPGVKVYGQTPAASVVVPWNLAVSEWPMTDAFKFSYMQTIMQSTSSQAPGEERGVDEKNMILTRENISRINAGTHGFYVYGTILYSDVFRVARYTNFCWHFDMTAIFARNGTDCPIHNGADWNNSTEPLRSLMKIPMK